MKRILQFLLDDDAATAVEYAVMLALILVVCLTSLAFFGSAAGGSYTDISNKIDSFFSGS